VARGYGLKRYDVILNACNQNVYRLTNPNQRKNFIYLGTVSEMKGINLMLDAFRLFKQRTHSDWKLTIVGPEAGITVQQMKDRVPEYFRSGDIQWVGKKRPIEIVQILNQHQVQIVPSIYVEAFGVVVLEGMASGCLVIGSDGDGIAEAMGKAGYLFKKGDVESLCAQMIKTSQLSEQEYAEQQQLMKENIEKLSLEHCAKQYLDLFQRAL
jgi:glycosyltransferase involved in cell wall biosynthesis